MAQWNLFDSLQLQCDSRIWDSKCEWSKHIPFATVWCELSWYSATITHRNTRRCTCHENRFLSLFLKFNKFAICALLYNFYAVYILRNISYLLAASLYTRGSFRSLPPHSDSFRKKKDDNLQEEISVVLTSKITVGNQGAEKTLFNVLLPQHPPINVHKSVISII
jgi:hypothetical protein